MKRAQYGAVVIEFALVLLMFLAFLFGIIEASRMLYAWNAATQAARVGARYAVVCADGTDTYKDAVLQRMRKWAPQISTIAIDWSPASCTASTCESVTVSVTGLEYRAVRSKRHLFALAFDEDRPVRLGQVAARAGR